MADMPDSKNSHASTISQKTPRGILHGPITPTLFRLALPTVVVLVAQTFVGVAETYFVSFLGIEALAGVTLVFPVLMLMQMMSNGGIGGGVSSAVARALGANRHADADADADADGRVWHSVVLATVFGAIFSFAAILFGPLLYRSMGGTGETLRAALIYSGIVFAGSIPIWITALLSAALRGAGNVNAPALVILSGAFLLRLVAAVDFRLGPFPGARRGGRRRCGLHLLSHRGTGACPIPALVKQPAKVQNRSAARSTVQGHSGCRPAFRSRHDPGQSDGYVRNGSRRPLWRRRDCGVRHRIAAGLSANPHHLRSWNRYRHHGWD